MFLYIFGSILTYLIFHISFNQQSVNSCFNIICNDNNAITLTNVCVWYSINVCLIQIQQFQFMSITIIMYIIQFISYFNFRNRVPFINVREKAYLEVCILLILSYFITCLVLKGFTSLLMYYSHEYDLFFYIKIYASTFKNVSLSYYSQFLFICPAVRNYIELYFSQKYQNLVSSNAHYKIKYVSIEIYFNLHISKNKYRRQ